MPIGYSSPARNLFLLGSSGAQVVTNFFKQIDQASSGDFFHTPSEIRYTESDEKFILAGQADKTSPSSEKYGWIEKRQENGTQDWEVQVSSTTENNTTLRALELDGFNLVAVGKTGGVPWIAKYTDGGVITWQSTTNSGDVEYTGVAVDSNSNYYACGSTPVSGEAQAFVEKFDSSGNPGWGKSAFMVGRDVVLNKISANSRGEVVAVGYLEDDSYNKGYIVKIDTTTGDVMWDRTLELNIPAANIELTGVDVDNNDEIYVCGNIKYDVFGQTILPVDGFIAKYTAEGNLLWQSQSDYASGTSSAVYYEDITIDNTTKKPTTFGYVRYAVGDSGTLISRYDPDGSLSWRREIDEGNSFDPRHTSVDGDQSFIYLLFADTADSETYVYGKVSATGNGLGDFEYDDGTGAPLLQYITSSGPSGSDIGEKIGRLSDGSVRQDTSDLITYPFNANKLLFDDLATQVANKKRQMDGPDSFEYSGSPAIRPADFQELNLLGENNFVGPDLITNGTFDTDTNGWSSGNGAILTVDNTALKISNNGTQISGFATQAITTVPGEQYTVAFEVIDDTSSQAWLRIGNNFGWVDIVNQNNNTTGTYETTFTAEGTLTYITFMVTVGNATRYTIVDNISVKQYKWLDQSGKGNDGGVSGATHNAAGYWEFDGDNDKIVVNSLSNFAPSEVTFEAWFKKPTGSGYKGLVDKGRDNYGAYTINVDETGSKATFTAKISGGNRSVVCATQYGSNVWTHVAGTYDGTDLKIYLNGSLDGTTNIPGVLGSNTLPITIGSTNDGLEYGGEIGEVRIYPRALTAAQVFQNYNATKSKYINEAPDTAPKIGPGIVYDSNLLLNYDFGNRATYDPVENLLSDNFTFGTDTGEYYTDELGVEHKIYSRDANLNEYFGSSATFTPGTYDLVVSMYVDLTDATSFYFRPQLTFGPPATATVVESDVPSLGSKGIMKVRYSNVQPSSNWFFTVRGTGTAKFARPFLQLEPDHTRYVKTYGTAITAPTTVKNLSSSSYTSNISASGAVFNSNGYFDFDGVDGHIELPSPLEIDVAATGWTVETWLKVPANQPTTGWHFLWADRGQLDPDSGDYETGIYNNNSTVFLFKNNSETTQVINAFLQPNTWHHIVFGQYTNGNRFIYRDSVLTGSNNETVSVGRLQFNKFFEREDPASTDNMLGSMGQLRIYNRGFLQAEVSQNFNATRSKYGV